MKAPTDESLSTLSLLAKKLYAAEETVLRLEAELKRAKEQRDRLQCTEIPEFLDAVGITEFSSGEMEVRVEDVLAVQPRKENRPLVLAELEKQGAGGLVKSTVTVAFNRGEDAKSKAIIDLLRKHGLVPKQEKKVEPSTLKKHVRTRLEKGESVDMDLFGVRRIRRATFAAGAPEEPVFDEE